MSVFCQARLLSSKECTLSHAANFVEAFDRENPGCSAATVENLRQVAASLRHSEGLPSTPGQLSVLKDVVKKKTKKSKKQKAADGGKKKMKKKKSKKEAQ